MLESTIIQLSPKELAKFNKQRTKKGTNKVHNETED